MCKSKIDDEAGHITDFKGLQKRLLEAVFDETALQLVLQEFADLCDAPFSQLMIAHRNRTLLRSTFNVELDIDIGPTEALYQDINPRVRATPFMKKGQSTRDKDFISHDGIQSDQTYQELILPAGLGHFSGVPVIHNNNMTAGIALHRRIMDDPFSDKESHLHEAASAACAPVLELASMIEHHSVRSTLDLFGADKTVAILDFKGRVLDQNQNFDRFLKSAAAHIDSDRKLIFKSPRDQTALKVALGSHIGVVGGAIALKNMTSNVAWVCRILPKPAFTIAGPEAGHALLVCDRIDTPLRLDRTLVQQVFELTQKETETAEFVFRGLSLKSIAEARKVSLETVRSHVKSLMQKTETNRQAELVAKLARFAHHSIA